MTNPFISKPSLRPALSFAALVATWWLTNNIFAIDAELLFRRFNSPFLYVDLTATQTLLGTLLTYAYITFRSSNNPKSTEISIMWAAAPLAIGTLHFMGSLLTNVSYAKIGSTSTLMWKLTEPMSAVVLKWLVLGQRTSPTSIFGVFITLSGVLLFSKSSFTLPNFSPIILSNLIFPTRNVFIKLTQRDLHVSSAVRFLNMLLVALPLCTVALAVKVSLYSGNIVAVAYMLRNALLFNAYQLSSFLLLERLDPLTHSLLNTLKRFTGILLSMIVIHMPLHGFHYQGIATTIIGFCVYLGGDGKKYKLGNYGFAAGVVVGIIAMLTVGNSALDVLRVTEFQPVSLSDSKIERLESTNVSVGAPQFSSESVKRDEYVVMVNKLYRDLRRNSTSYKSYDHAISIGSETGNVGNLIWNYGALEKLVDFTSTDFCFSDGTGNCQKMARKQGKKLVFYLPLANMLHPRNLEMFSSYLGGMKRGRMDEVVIVGLGIQVEFRNNSDDPEFNSKAKITAKSDDFPTAELTKKFLRVMGERGGQMLLRGEFTHRVLQAEGFKKSYAVGCPSFWINKDVHLGRNLEPKYRAIAKRVGDKSLRVAVNIKRVKGFDDQIKHFRDNYPNSRFYAQGNPDLTLLRGLNVPLERVRFFTNAEDWIADLRDMEVSYGVRIHGNMIALAAGVPVIVTASDWRVLELTEVMNLPHYTTYDKVFDNEIDMAELVKGKLSEFNGEEFDRNRCELAKVFINVFSKYSLEVQDHVRQVSQLC